MIETSGPVWVRKLVVHPHAGDTAEVDKCLRAAAALAIQEDIDVELQIKGNRYLINCERLKAVMSDSQVFDVNEPVDGTPP